jgi:hypothetical protein
VPKILIEAGVLYPLERTQIGAPPHDVREPKLMQSEPCSDAGIDPEFPGDAAGSRNRRRTGILRGFGLAGNARSNPCPYARSSGCLQEAAAICMVRHQINSCGKL